MAIATNLPKHALLARCAEIFLSRLDVEDPLDVAEACSQLRKKHSPMTYLNQLQEAATLVHSKNNINKAAKVLTEAQGNSANSNVSYRDGLLSVAYPVLTSMDVLLAVDHVDAAIDIATKMEACTLLSEHDQSRAWTKIFHYLVQTGRVFLDGFSLHEADYMAKRNIILLNIVGKSERTGVDAFLDGYLSILKQVTRIRNMTDDERICIQRACHQTVLRIFQSKVSLRVKPDTTKDS